ncbi:MAG: sugar phosphate nucleotidyltransferase [Patescibacteria group bacterium]
MQAVILAAGVGKRMLPLTLDLPKPLVRVAGRTIIEYVLTALPSEIDEIILIVGYKAEMIKDFLGEVYKGRVIRYVHQEKPEGTARALALAQPYISGRFILMNADDIHGAEALKEALQYPLAVLVAPYRDPSRMGVVSCREDGTLESIIEKPEHPESNVVSTGAMILDEQIFMYETPQNENGEYYINEPLKMLAADKPITVVTQPLWIPVGCPEDISLAEERLKDIEERGDT